MRRTALFLATALLLFPMAAHAEGSPKTYTDAEKTALGEVIRDYLVNKNPEVLKEAMTELQRREQAAAINPQKEKLYNDPTSPVGGTPKGDVTIVEFFDYQCGYCKMVQDTVAKVLKEDRKVKIIYKEYPILSPESGAAAKAALASVKQGKYEKYHAALMHKKEHFKDDMIYDIAKSVGLDVDQLKKDAEDPAIAKAIEDNLSLGQAVGANGTPTFIIGDTLVSSALSYEQMKKDIAAARAARGQ